MCVWIMWLHWYISWISIKYKHIKLSWHQLVYIGIPHKFGNWSISKITTYIVSSYFTNLYNVVNCNNSEYIILECIYEILPISLILAISYISTTHESSEYNICSKSHAWCISNLRMNSHVCLNCVIISIYVVDIDKI